MTHMTPIDPPACGCQSVAQTCGLISVPEALARIDRTVSPVAGVDSLPVAMARGRILAVPIAAMTDAPGFDVSAMDGYAIRVADLAGAGPWPLPVVGQVAAGQLADNPLPDGVATRIFTGAPLPQGADTVVMQEDVQAGPGGIVLADLPRSGAHIRRQGEDMAEGDAALSKGRRLTPRDLAVAAAAGHDHLMLRRGLRVALIVTGDELSARRGAARVSRM